MKALVFAVLLTVMQAAPAAPRKSASPDKPQPQATRLNENEAKPVAGKDTEQIIGISKLPPVSVERLPKKDWTDWFYFVFSLLLVVVGGLQVWLLSRTLLLVRRQTREMMRQRVTMGGQLEAMRGQLTAMERQTPHLEASVWAAQSSADAAMKNIELVISKERARLRIKLSDLKLVPEGDLGVYLVNFTVNIVGTTPAFITDTRCGGGIVDPQIIDDAETGDRGMVPLQRFPDVIAPDSQPIPKFAIFHSSGNESDGLLEEVKANRLFVMLRGFIKYKDVFDRERVTNFRYVWKYEDFTVPPDTERWGHWERCGQPEDNKET
jgi:hypothetical protein